MTEHDKLKDLHKEAFSLSGQIRSESFLPIKKRLDQKRQSVLTEIHDLEEKKQQKAEAEATEKINELIHKNRMFTNVMINGIQTSINEKDLTVKVKYLPCGHEEDISTAELLRSYEFFRSKKTAESNTRLLTRWERLYIDNTTIEGSVNCSRCRKDKESKLKMFRRYDDSPVGKASFLLRKLQ